MKSKSLFFVILLTLTRSGFAEEITAVSIQPHKEQNQPVLQMLRSAPQLQANENLQPETEKEFTLSDVNKCQVAAGIVCVAVLLGFVATRASY